MKKCNNCGKIYLDSFEVCPDCKQALIEYVPSESKTISDEISSFSTRLKVLLIAAMIASFFVGFIFHIAVGVKKSAYTQALNYADAVNSQLKTTKNDLQTLQTTYDDYKSKMQPYEAQQEADAKAAEEEKAKKEAEEKAKAEQAAKEKAEQEAAQKAADDAAAKSKTFGINANDFYTSYNNIAASNGFDVFLGKSTSSGDSVTYLTLNDDVSVETYSYKGYVQMVYVSMKRTTSQSLSDASYYAVTAAVTLDPSLSIDDASGILTNVLNGSVDNYGNDYSITNNGITITANTIDTSILFCFAKQS